MDTREMVFLWILAPAFLGLLYRLATVSHYPRVGKSRLRTFLLRELPMRWALDKYSVEGYQKFHSQGQPFLAKVFGHDYWVMPPRYLDDLKSSVQSLSFLQALSDSFNMQASVGNLYHSTTEISVVTKYMNTQFALITPLVADEAAFAMETEVGKLSDWKSFNAAQLGATLVHRATSRILVGPELCRNQRYLAVSARFSRSLFIYGTLWNGVALGPLRRLFAWLTIGGHLRDLHEAVDMLLPVIQQRRMEMVGGGEDLLVKYPDVIQWTLETDPSMPGDDSPLHKAWHVMHLTFAASSAAGVLVTQALMQLLMSPQYLGPLRAELEEVLEGEGGQWTDQVVMNMPLMDSFLRETMRLHPAGSLTCARTVMTERFTFSDGFTLPRGSRIITPALAIHRDPANYSNPDEFDGFRFAPAHGGDGRRASTADKTFLQFGYGAHACPGRFYGIRKAKVVLGMLVLNYDLQWDGEVTARPADVSVEAQLIPNQEQRILLRRRGVQ